MLIFYAPSNAINIVNAITLYLAAYLIFVNGKTMSDLDFSVSVQVILYNLMFELVCVFCHLLGWIGV